MGKVTVGILAVLLGVILGGLGGFSAAQALAFRQSAEDAGKAAKLAMMDAGMELAEAFYEEDNEDFAVVRESITACAKLQPAVAADSEGKEGAVFDAEALAKYLGFLDDLGFFHRDGELSLALLDHFFGEPVLEAYENAGVRRHLDGLPAKPGGGPAFPEFLALGQALEQLPARQALVEAVKKRCPPVP